MEAEMNRRKQRDHLFRLAFGIDFTKETVDVSTYLEEAGVEEEDVKAVLETKLSQIYDHLESIDAAIEKASIRWSIERIAKVELSILRVAVYEMFYDDQVPMGVAINEAVEIAKKYGEETASKFVNGILGKVAKESDHES